MLQRLALAVLLLVPFVAQARERAVLIYPRERAWFRRVFYTPHQRELRARLAAQYDVELHEQVSSDRELFDIDIDGAELLVLSAHGDPFAMHFAGRKSRTLDSSDRARLAAFFDRLHPFATIVLQSCHTGRGFAHVVKEAAGPTRRVIAARGEVPWDGLRITSVAPLDVAIDCNDGDRRWDCTVQLR
ncbi:MAG TPA: hypothetical protein VNI54_10125 [Thermoanaerobaculia bacterium]|nr:hypothetical protein [Thermoanaerobaculia bacterium]